ASWASWTASRANSSGRWRGKGGCERMMPGMRRSSRDLRLNADINITNLVDVAFVLLIIFIITAPILQGGVEVELPKADAAPITSPDAVIVSITKDEKLFVGDVPVASIEELER